MFNYFANANSIRNTVGENKGSYKNDELSTKLKSDKGQGKRNVKC